MRNLPLFAPFEINETPNDQTRTALLVELLMGTPVNNAISTSLYSPALGSSWLSFYRLYSGNDAAICSMVGCNNPAEVGAHVSLPSSSTKSLYIVPACKGCNNTSTSLTVRRGVQLVPELRR